MHSATPTHHRAAALCAILLAVCLGAISAPALPASSLAGNWADPDGSVIRIEPCGGALCLRIVALSAKAPSTEDIHNPDAAQRSRPLCGLVIGTGFQADGTKASGGSLYDPKSGNTYHGQMALDGDTLKLRGYVGVSLFGRTEIWHRAPADPGPCVQPRAH